MSSQNLTQAAAQQVADNATAARRRKQIGIVLNYALLIFLSFIFLFPVVFMFVSSFKPNAVIFEDLRSVRAFLPTTASMNNYQSVFQRSNFPLFMTNSVIIVTITVVLGIFVNSMAAYVLARLRWTGRRLILAVIIALLIVPFEAIAIPLVLLSANLPYVAITGGEIELVNTWLNTHHVQIIPFIGDAFSIFLFYQFFIDIPRDLDEAALVDGASPFRIYWNIILPMARPTIATVAILQFLTRWNDYLWPVIAVQGEQARPVMVGMAAFFGQTPDWGQIMAYATMITFPVLLVYLLFQRWFIQSVASSGIKG